MKMSKPKVYVTDSEFPDYSFEEQVITEAGGELIGLQCKTEEDIIAQCHGRIDAALISCRNGNCRSNLS